MWFDQKPKWKKSTVFIVKQDSDDDDKKEQRSKKEREKDQSAWDMKVVNDVCCVMRVKVSKEHRFFRAGMDELSCVFVLHFVYCKKILSMTLHSVVRYTLYDVR